MDSMRGKLRAIKKILLVFLIAVLLTGCGKKRNPSVYTGRHIIITETNMSQGHWSLLSRNVRRLVWTFFA